MSVKTLESYQEFTADGSTTYFTFNFNYVDSSEIVVGMRTGDNQYTVVDPVNYVLTKNASTDGGKIRFVTTKPCENPDDPTCGDYIDNPPPAGTIVRIERKTVRSSTADWYVGLDMNSLVGLFDKLIRITQENTDKFKNTIQTFPTQQGITVRELLSEHDKKIFYWNNEKQWLDITDFTIDDIARQTDVGDILGQANAYSDGQNALLESKINGKLTAVESQIDANADAIQKTREDYIQADSEIRQILNSHTNELTTLRGNQASLGDQVSGIEEKIPGSASATNQLVTKEDLKSIDLEGYATTEYVNAREQEIRDDVNQADSELQSQITAQASAITANTTSINGVKAVIPDGTSDTNPLINKQQLLDEEMDIRDDLNEMASELQTQITAQAAEIATKQDQLIAGDNIVITGNTISATGTGGVGFDMQVVNQLPATGKKGVIYLVPKDGTAPDVHDEYVWIDATQTFELIGTTQVDLTDYVKKTDYATASTYGVVKVNTNGIYGIGMNDSAGLFVTSATETQIAAKTNSNRVISPKVLDYAVKVGVTTNTIALTDEEKSAAQAWLGVSGGGAGGLESVATDSTLQGHGTSSSPLGLSSETINRFEDIEKVIPGIANEDNKLCTYEEMHDEFQVVSDELTGLRESISTKDLTVGTSEGTLNLSITAGVATIATNNGLDIVAQTKFDTAPTTDDNTTYANALDTSLVRKAQVATAIADAMANVDALPDQTGNAEKVLTTDGTNASWTEMPGLIIRRL